MPSVYICCVRNGVCTPTSRVAACLLPIPKSPLDEQRKKKREKKLCACAIRTAFFFEMNQLMRRKKRFGWFDRKFVYMKLGFFKGPDSLNISKMLFIIIWDRSRVRYIMCIILYYNMLYDGDCYSASYRIGNNWYRKAAREGGRITWWLSILYVAFAYSASKYQFKQAMQIAYGFLFVCQPYARLLKLCRKSLRGWWNFPSSLSLFPLLFFCFMFAIFSS